MSLLTAWRTRTRQTLAAVALGAIVVGTLGAPAQALPTDKSEAEGRLLSGGGVINLNDIAALNPAYSADPSQTGSNAHPLDAEVLRALNLDLGGGVQLFGANPVIAVGALNQYANTDPTRPPFAAAGAVSSDGSIAVAPAGQNGDAYVRLTPLLQQAGLDGLASELELNLGAISSNATLDAEGNPVRDYQVANGKLMLTSPAVKGLSGQLSQASVPISNSLNGLVGQNGAINTAMNPLLGQIQSTLNTALLGLGRVDNLSVTATVDTNLQPALDTVLAQSITSQDKALSIDLSTGKVVVDVARLIATANGTAYDGTLNGLPANTEILSPDLL